MCKSKVKVFKRHHWRSNLQQVPAITPRVFHAETTRVIIYIYIIYIYINNIYIYIYIYTGIYKSFNRLNKIYIYIIYIYIYIYIYIIYTYIYNAIVRLTHSRSGDSQGQETFFAPSTEKDTRNYDTECSNHNEI